MKDWSSVTKLSLLGAFAFTIVSCGASTRTDQSELAKTTEANACEDSGKRLSGDFALIDVEDAYRLTSSRMAPQTTFSFEENGNFKKQESSRIDEGSYLIGTRSELVIYVEKMNGEALAAARIDRYVITEQGSDSITLQSSPSRKLVFRRR